MFSNKIGLNSLLKDGMKIVKNNEETIIKNVDACKEICNIIQTSLGPKCMNKLIINHINKKIVSSDCMTILKDLEINHPVVNILKRLSEIMNYEYGDCTNYVFILTSELLDKATFLIREGFNVNNILEGFNLGHKEINKIFPSLVVYQVKDFYDENEIADLIKPVMITKQLATNIDIIVKLLAKCITDLMPNNLEHFDVDNIRVAKLNGGNLVDSQYINGIIVLKETHGIVKKKENANVIVLNCSLEAVTTETKGTVLLHNAQELLNFTKGEEDQMEAIIKSIKDCDVDVIVVNGSISDIAQHFCDKYNIMTLKITSKFETMRIAKLLCVSSMIRLEKPTLENIGKVNSIYVTEIASKKVTIINGKNKKVATILLRGATYNLLDEVERCIHDGINCVKNAIKHNKFVYGGGCVEIQLIQKLLKYSNSLKGMNNFTLKVFASAFEIIPKILAMNSGYSGTDVLNELMTEHENNNTEACISINRNSHITSAKENKIYDNMKCKQYAIDISLDAIHTILKIDQIILAKPAGGPKLREKNPNFDD